MDPNKKAPRKQRKIVRKLPTPEENRAFESMYREQQQIFQSLLTEDEAAKASVETRQD
jgi:hypothetical protein